MIDKALPPDSLKQRRQALRNQRRSRGWQALGRFLVVGGLATGLVWVMAGSRWTIRSAEQVKISGNRLVSDKSIRSTLGVSYPLSIWEMPIDRFQEKLTINPALAGVRIERGLFPPEMRVEIIERQPVARTRQGREEGFIDADGTRIPKRYYDRATTGSRLPTLEAIGYTEQYKIRWQKLYPYLQNLPVKITAIDWRDPSNLVLNTSVEKVYLGSPDDRLGEKLDAFVQTRQLSAKIPPDRILYIDLSEPNAPTVQVKPDSLPKAEKPTLPPR
jgi:cell division protein FtsQ